MIRRDYDGEQWAHEWAMRTTGVQDRRSGGMTSRDVVSREIALLFCADFCATFGFAPSFMEISRALGDCSLSSVNRIVGELAQADYIDVVGTERQATARAMQLTLRGRRAVGRIRDRLDTNDPVVGILRGVAS